MTTAMTNQKDKQVVRPLRVLVPLIKKDLANGKEASESAGMPYRKAAGEKMIEARDGNNMTVKDLCDWSKRNFNLGRSQTLLYVSYAAATGGLSGRPDAFSSMTDFQRKHLGHDIKNTVRPQAWHEPVKKIIGRVDVDTLNLRQSELKRIDERDAERKLAMQLIDIGYKALATKLHPDKGGSRDAMSRLNRVRDRLRTHA